MLLKTPHTVWCKELINKEALNVNIFTNHTEIHAS